MTVGCIDSECGHDAHHHQVMPTDDSALIIVEGMRPTCTTSDRAGWPVASAPVRGGGEFALPPAFATGPRCLLARVLEEGENWGPEGRKLEPWRKKPRAQYRENWDQYVVGGGDLGTRRALQVLTSWQMSMVAQAPP